MCGIAGFVDFAGNTKPETLTSMIGEIVHRGPDSKGLFYSANGDAALGVRRLSIIDLVTGDQPIQNEDGSITVVYNGEIYNYKKLREDLIKKGHKFRTKSDTETLVHAYEEYGEEMAKKLNGMFAFAIWDEKKQKLFMARDRAGIKPMYFYKSADLLAFGSEVKTILKNPAYNKKISLEALNYYCYLGYVPADFSLFSGVHKLLPGHTLSFTRSTFRIDKYFELSFKNIPHNKSLDSLLEGAVIKQLHADVPVGVFLSGGLDSSLVSYYITQNRKKMKSFSISFEDPDFDESKFATSVSKKLHTQHYEERFSVSEVPTLFSEISAKLDEPLADASLLPTYKVSKLAGRYVKVALSGDGGDELFGGYPTYQAHIISDTLKHIPKAILDSGIFLLDLFPNSFGNYPRKDLAKIVIKAMKMSPFERQIYMMRTFFLGDTSLRNKPAFGEIEKLLPKNTLNLKPSLKAQAIDFYTYLRDDFLVKTDRASMYNSLEVRVPFLDNALIDYAYSVNAKHVDLLKTKKQLRELALKKLGSSEIAKRPKKGFGIPVAKWLKGELKDFGYSMLLNKKLNNYISRKKINKIWQEHQKTENNFGGTIWLLIVLSGWLDNWT